MKKIIDGNEAAAYCSYAFSEASVIYPITPSSEMGMLVEKWSVEGKKNLFEQIPLVETMQSEKGVGGMLHGLLRSGVLATTFTCSQGLLLLLPSLYKIVGELLPGVIHVSARALSTSALCIHGDHSDVMGVRQSGVLMLASSNVQEVALFSTCAHLLSLSSELPVLHFFDGFDTSHEVRNIELPSYEELQSLIPVEAIQRFKAKALRNDRPKAYGAVQTEATFFQQQELINPFYEQVPGKLKAILEKCNTLFKTNAKLIDYYGNPAAETVFVAMGSVAGVIREVVDEQNQLGEKIGFLNIHLYRPFPESSFLETLPKTTKNIIVLDRCKETGATSEPLLADVRNCVFDLSLKVIGGRYGLGSKDTVPSDIRATLCEIKKETPMKRFTLGIEDNQTNLSLQPVELSNVIKNKKVKEALTIKTWGRGSDGAVSCNRQTAEIIGEQTNFNVQGKFWFDPRKTNNLTISELRVSSVPILSSYRLQQVKVVNCYHESYLKKYNLIAELEENGILLINTNRSRKCLEKILSNNQKKMLSDKNISIYTIDASGLARRYELGLYINVLMQASLFKILKLLEFNQVLDFLKEKIHHHYMHKSVELGEANIAALDEVLSHLKKIELPREWQQLKETPVEIRETIKEKVEQNQAVKITVRELKDEGMEDGSCSLGMTQTEKRGLAKCLPDWESEKCIQCNLCATVCPHAAIRPFILENDTTLTSLPSKEFPGKKYRIQASPLDCTECLACIDICPKKCLTMQPVEEKIDEIEKWEQLDKKPIFDDLKLMASNRTVQYRQPLLEFSGACAGCGETSYVKLLTQLFGSNLVIANATGCSSIWGGTFPYISYTTDHFGHGPAWGTSLLENNAEYGLGITLGLKYNRQILEDKLHKIKNNSKHSKELQQAIDDWLLEENNSTTNQLLMSMTNEYSLSKDLTEIFEQKHFMNNKVTWIVGGDGWAYDIDSDGIDYLITQNMDVNLLILDNGSYANTGGQYTSSTPRGASVKFKTKNQKNRKNLTYLAMQRENVYVAQICLGENSEQAFQALKEAAAFKGPSIVVAYSPCLMQGIHFNSYLKEQQLAVKSGFWPLLRYNPTKKRPLRIESSKPNEALLKEFFGGEARFSNESFKQEYSIIIKKIQETYQKYQTLKKIFNA